MEYIERKRTAFLGLPIYFTKYKVQEDMITMYSGLLKTVEDDVYMYKVQDVKLTRTLLERVFHLGTVVCYSGDITHPELVMKHIKHSTEIKDFILRESEEERRKKRTLHTMDLDFDGQPDDIDDMEG